MRRVSPHLPSFRAFTITELLITAGVIAVLMSLLIPSLGKILGRSGAAQSLSNQRQIAAALLSYANDNGGTLPYAYEKNLSKVPGQQHFAWTRVLAMGGYLPDARVFFQAFPKSWRLNASDSNSLQGALRSPSTYDAIVPWRYADFCVNRWGAMPISDPGGAIDDSDLKPANINRIAGEGAVSKLMLLRNGYDPSNPTRGYGAYRFNTTEHLPAVGSGGYQFYDGYLHAAFADGHVETISLADMWKLSASGKEAPMFKYVFTKN